jgi:hypothetical protein
MLRTLSIVGRVPFRPLLALCGPSLKELDVTYLSVVWHDTLVSSRRERINLEGLRLYHNSSTYGQPNLVRHLLSPEESFNLKTLRRLEVTHNRPWDVDLCNIVAASVGSLESLSVSFKGAFLNNFGIYRWANDLASSPSSELPPQTSEGMQPRDNIS